MSIYKTILRQSAIYSLSLIASKLASFILLPVYTAYLSPRDYGLMELIETLTFSLSAFLGARLGDAFLYFYGQSSTDLDKHQVFSTAFWGATVLGILSASLGWFGAATFSTIVFGTAEFSTYLQLAFAAFAVSFPLEVSTSYLRAVNRASSFVAIQLLKLILTVAINLTLMIRFRLTIEAILWSSVISSAVCVALSVVLIRPGGLAVFSPSLFLAHIRYGWPLGISALGMLLIHNGDRFFLQRVATLEDVGRYGLAYKIGMLVSYAQLAFITYWNAQIYQLSKQPGGERIYTKTFSYYMIALASMGVVIAGSARSIIYYFTPPSYHQAADLVPLIALAYIIRGAGDYFRAAFLISNTTSRNLFVTATGVVITLISYTTLIPRYRVWGAAVATMITFIAMSYCAFYSAQQVRPFSFDWSRIFKLLVAILASLGMIFLSPSGSLVVASTFGLASIVCFGLLLVLLRVFEASEIRMILSWSPRRS